MLHQHTLDKLYQLRLTGMAAALEQQLAQPAIQELSFEERFGLLLDQEMANMFADDRLDLMENGLELQPASESD